MKGFFITIILISTLATFSSAQYANNWYFGNRAALNFNTEPPSTLTNSAMIFGLAGNATVSDSLGNLLFYTNGDTVWNRNHTVMLNGTAIGGNIQSGQPAVIIPKPGSKSVYYVFTSPKQFFESLPTFCYSEIDMALDAGMGGVTANKRIPLYSPGTEKLTAAIHANGIDYWIITKEDNYYNHRFRVFKVTCQGPQLFTPVISASFPTGPGSGGHHFGSLKVSPDAKKIVDILPVWRLPGGQETQGFNLFSFDNSTGMITSPVRYIDPNSGGFWYSGAEFSEDSKFLYACHAKKLTQFRVDVLNSAAIANSAYRINSNLSQGAIRSLQIGPDGKIYISGVNEFGILDSVLAVISNPEAAGIGCNYSDNHIYLGRRSGGLPNFPINLVLNTEADFTYAISGACNTFSFSATSHIQGSLQWEWDFGDNTTAIGQNVVHAFPADSVNYTVSLIVRKEDPCGKTVRKKKIVAVNRKAGVANFDFIASCDRPSVSFTNHSVLDAPFQPSGFLWEFGDGTHSALENPTHLYSAFGSYTVRLTVFTAGNCIVPITFEKNIVSAQSMHSIFAGRDTILSKGQFYQLSGSGTQQCTWFPATGLSNANSCAPVLNTAFTSDGLTYILNGTDLNGCTGSDTVHIKIYNGPEIYVPGSFTPNNDGLNDYLRPICVGIKRLNYFRVFNRWGNTVYSGSGFGASWNGTFMNSRQTGTFIWMAEGTTANGQIIQRKGTSILLR